MKEENPFCREFKLKFNYDGIPMQSDAVVWEWIKKV